MAAIEAVVTGAASGIGRACAERLEREGLAVLAVDKNGAGLEDFRARGVATLVADLALESERDRVVAAATGARYLVNAAGVIRLCQRRRGARSTGSVTSRMASPIWID
jgi:NAD(P)-dependent dehydrogenase (short-subunit alcohol dehydrogenase family)